MSKGAQIAVGATLIAFLLAWYGYAAVSRDGTFLYYQTLAELRSAQPGLGDQALRVHGYVALDSIDRDVASKQVRFAVQNDPPHAVGAAEDSLIVIFQSLETPDLFKDGAEVVVEGKLQQVGGDTVFLADNVMAKCPSKFQAKAETSAL
ncbi:MAG: cytochrome c maturation protein CcmE, partial [Myxococcota bacterium]